MRHFMRNEKGFTLIELLIVVVIIGILAAVGVPIYSRYITSARASEAPTQMMAIREYAQSYIKAHPTHMFDATSLLNAALSVMPTAAHAQDTTQPVASATPNWLAEVVGSDNAYFGYTWGGGADTTIKAWANSDLCPTCAGDRMVFTFDALGNDAGWSVTPAGSRLKDVLPN